MYGHKIERRKNEYIFYRYFMKISEAKAEKKCWKVKLSKKII